MNWANNPIRHRFRRMRVLTDEIAMTVDEAATELEQWCRSHPDATQTGDIENLYRALQEDEGWRELGAEEGYFSRSRITVEVALMPSALGRMDEALDLLLRQLLLHYFPECQGYLLSFTGAEKAVGTGFSHTSLGFIHTRVTFNAIIFNPFCDPKKFFPGRVITCKENFVLVRCMDFFTVKFPAKMLQEHQLVYVKDPICRYWVMKDVDRKQAVKNQNLINQHGVTVSAPKNSMALKPILADELDENDEELQMESAGDYNSTSKVPLSQEKRQELLAYMNTKALIPEQTRVKFKIEPHSNGEPGSDAQVEVARTNVIAKVFQFAEGGKLKRKRKNREGADVPGTEQGVAADAGGVEKEEPQSIAPDVASSAEKKKKKKRDRKDAEDEDEVLESVDQVLGALENELGGAKKKKKKKRAEDHESERIGGA
ncbi:unnamed protein product [Amoebophrya sp. A120]|nr:unnamed protein product [Amoebophrya sp. A120]|eukprot:GSA120T00020182001.1